MNKKLLMVLFAVLFFVGIVAKIGMVGKSGVFSDNKEEKIILGFLPNKDSLEFKDFRDGVAAELEIATGKKVEVRTTDSYDVDRLQYIEQKNIGMI